MTIRQFLLTAAVLSMTAITATPAFAATTVLDFGTSSCAGGCVDFSPIDQSYGDQAGLDISYRSLTAPGNSSVGQPKVYYWSAGYGDLNGVAWGSETDANAVPEITFTVGTGKQITLNSLDYAGWIINRNTSFRLYDLAYNELFNSGAVVAPGSGHATLTFPTLSSTSGFRLQWGPDGYNGGIDNLTFSLTDVTSAAPEPATWLMMIMGFGLIGAILRRRKGQTAIVAA